MRKLLLSSAFLYPTYAYASDGATGGDALTGFGVLAIIFAAYMFPTIIAIARRHYNALAISMLNLFLGWSVLGWIGALVWACTSNRNQARA